MPPVNDDDERNYCCVHLAIDVVALQLVAVNADGEVTAAVGSDVMEAAERSNVAAHCASSPGSAAAEGASGFVTA